MSAVTPGSSGGSGAVGTQPRLQPALATLLSTVATAPSSSPTAKRILFAGDSRTSGAISVLLCSPGWFTLLANLLAPLLGTEFGALTNSSPTVTRGLVIPTSEPDSRWTPGTNWNYNALSTQIGWAPGESNAPAGGAFYGGNGATGTLTFNPNPGTPVPALFCDEFTVLYGTEVSGGGTCTGQGTGGTATALTINTGTSGVAKQTFNTGGAANTNTFTLTLSAAGPVKIFAVEPQLSLGSQILLGQAGVNGASTVAWNTAPSQAHQGSVDLINLYNPDLVIWELFGDDCFVTGDSVQTAQTNLTALINATVGASKSVLMSISGIGPFGGLANPPSALDGYMNGLQQLAQQLGCPYIDLYSSWGKLNAYNLLTSLYSADQLHPNTAGYYEQARYIAQALAGILGTM